MKPHFTLRDLFWLVLVCPMLFSIAKSIAEEQRVPPLCLLETLAGSRADSPEISELKKAYIFSKNPKREGSWGSAFGVFLRITAEDKVAIGIRPPSSRTNMPTYPGKLPGGLKKGDSIEAIEKKLGKPLKTRGDPDQHFVMSYERMNVVTLGGSLFEIWLNRAPKEIKEK